MAQAARVKVPSGSLAASQAWDGTTGASSPGTSAAVVPSGKADGMEMDLAAMAISQVACPDVERLRESSSLQLVQVEVGAARLWFNISTGRQRPLVPRDWRQKVFTAIHGLAHPGIRATRRLVAARFVWPGLATDVEAWCRDCVECQRAKVTRQPAAPVQPIPVPSRRFSHLCGRLALWSALMHWSLLGWPGTDTESRRS